MLNKSIGLIFLCFSTLVAQSIYEPTYNLEIYKFLDRQAHKGIISLFDDIRPISREKITKKIFELEKNSHRLTEIEKQQLKFYESEYLFESKYLDKDTSMFSEFLSSRKTDRLNVYKYYDKNFTFEIDPIFQIKYDFAKKNYFQFGGIKFKGRINDFIGYYFSYQDFIEDGQEIDVNKQFTNITGVKNLRYTLNEHSEYSETRGGITFGWTWGNFTFAKDFLNIGSSYQSSIILSNKAPSFPHLRLEIEPVSWFKYNFIHAWLDSKMIDSTTIRYSGVTSTVLDVSKNFSRRFKYYVSHTFSFQPIQKWWISFGESIIYGDQLEPIYFIPVFLRLADHYNFLGGGDTGDNAQIFFNSSYNWSQIRSKLYFSLYIDEMSITELLKGSGNNANVFAWTFGGRISNPLWNDSYITLEYSAVKPYAYMNADPLHQYSSSDYQLGHWMGSNAQQVYIAFEQYFTRSIKLGSFFQFIQKGSKEDINNYYNRVTATYPLLSGNVSTYSEAGLSLVFNPLHNLYFSLEYSNIFEANKRFTDEYGIKRGASFSTSLMYGL